MVGRMNIKVHLPHRVYGLFLGQVPGTFR